jgi:hypothetical protein
VKSTVEEKDIEQGICTAAGGIAEGL